MILAWSLLCSCSWKQLELESCEVSTGMVSKDGLFSHVFSSSALLCIFPVNRVQWYQYFCEDQAQGWKKQEAEFVKVLLGYIGYPWSYAIISATFCGLEYSQVLPRFKRGEKWSPVHLMTGTG